MKNGRNLSAILVILGIFCFSSAFSQEDRLQELDSFNKENRPDANHELLLEGESKINKPAVLSRDTVQVKSTSNKPEKGKPDENKSVLSFNFLYYLIERFKLSDIVD